MWLVYSSGQISWVGNEPRVTFNPTSRQEAQLRPHKSYYCRTPRSHSSQSAVNHKSAVLVLTDTAPQNKRLALPCEPPSPGFPKKTKVAPPDSSALGKTFRSQMSAWAYQPSRFTWYSRAARIRAKQTGTLWNDIPCCF